MSGASINEAELWKLMLDLLLRLHLVQPPSNKEDGE